MQDVQGLQDVSGKRGYMIPKDYVCDGQLNIWDIMSQMEKPEEPEDEFTPVWEPCGKDFPEVDPDVASGKKKPYEYDFERYIGQKVWCYLPDEDEPQIGEIIAFDHYYTEVKVHYEEYALTNLTVKPCILPTLEEAIALITEKYGLEFETYQGEWNLPDNPTIYKHVFKKHSVLEISESHYWSAKGRDAFKGARFIAVDWDGWHESVGRPCDDIAEIYHGVEYAIYRNEHAKKPKKRGEEDEES